MRRKLIYALIVAVLLTGGAMVSAQDDAPPEALTGFYVITGESGGFAEDGDGFLLTLESVSELTPWVISQPELFSGAIETVFLTLDWAAAEGLQASANIQAGDANLNVLLSEPFYDPLAGTLTVKVEVVDIYMEEAPKGGPTPPEAFEQASLFITLDAAFENGLLMGAEARGEGTRVDRDSNVRRPRPPARDRGG